MELLHSQGVQGYSDSYYFDIYYPIVFSKVLFVIPVDYVGNDNVRHYAPVDLAVGITSSSNNKARIVSFQNQMGDVRILAFGIV